MQSPLIPIKPHTVPLLTAEEFKAVVLRLQRNIRRGHALGRACIHTFLLIFFSRVLCLWGGSTGILASSLFFAALVIEIGVFLYFCSISKNPTTAERLITFVENSHDAAHLGIILELQTAAMRPGIRWHPVYTAAYAAIVRLLPLVQPDDSDAFNTQQRVYLRRSLFPIRSSSGDGGKYLPVPCLLALSALEQIGDKRDLPDVERLLKANAITDELRMAAENCAQAIRMRIIREDASSMLLRANQKPETINTLLRPSEENASIPPRQLLRATASDERDKPT